MNLTLKHKIADIENFIIKLEIGEGIYTENRRRNLIYNAKTEIRKLRIKMNILQEDK